MNRSFDCNSCEDFINMSSTAQIRPNKSIEIRNLSGDQVKLRPYMDQARILCKDNKTDILSLLTQIDHKINKGMLIRGNNVPLFKQRVNDVCGEWPFEVSFDDLFSIPDNSPFNYDDLTGCNSRVMMLDSDMLDLEKKVAEESDNLYSGISDIRSKCLDVDNQIMKCIRNLDQLSENYEPRYPKILMDLSTKHKSYYTVCDRSTDKLEDMIYQKNCNEIPDNIPDIFSNAVLVPNMISKEIEFNRSLLHNLHKNVRNKQLILTNLQDKIPEKREIHFFEPVQKFLKTMIEMSNLSDEESDQDLDKSMDQELGEDSDEEFSEGSDEGSDEGSVEGSAEGLGGRLSEELNKEIGGNGVTQVDTTQEPVTHQQQQQQKQQQQQQQKQVMGSYPNNLSPTEEQEIKQALDQLNPNNLKGGNYELSFF